jgi:hypothetical protein
MADQLVKYHVVALLLRSGFETGGFLPVRQINTSTPPRGIFSRILGRKRGVTRMGRIQSASRRDRFHRGRWFATVGEFTTSFYTQMGDTARGGAETFATHDFERIEQFVAKILSEEAKS